MSSSLCDIGSLERASATMFFSPFMCLNSGPNSSTRRVPILPSRQPSAKPGGSYFAKTIPNLLPYFGKCLLKFGKCFLTFWQNKSRGSVILSHTFAKCSKALPNLSALFANLMPCQICFDHNYLLTQLATVCCKQTPFCVDLR